MPPPKPWPCRVHAFIDGQNLFHSVRRVFGYTFPNYDPLRLAAAVTALTPDRKLTQVHFYTGIPTLSQDRRWLGFWSAKIRAMKTAGIRVVTRTLRYSPGLVLMPDGSVQTVPIGREKGIDLRIALDLLSLARHGEFDVALIFSQDSDLAEVVQEIGELRRELNRWLVVDSTYPHNLGSSIHSHGIPGARPLPFDKALYDTCIDPVNYFPPPPTPRLPGII
jgi:uncharacterized LabA/DUF88 family protein